MASCITDILKFKKPNPYSLAKGNYNGIVTELTREAREDVEWWLENYNTNKLVSHGPPNIIIRTDASKKGWGAAVETRSTGGRWTKTEANRHINILELHAALLGLQSSRNTLSGKHVLLQMDNSTAVTYVRNMGGTHSLECNWLAQTIIEWCKGNNIWISATHLPGIENTEADRESRIFNNNTEWTLSDKIFNKIIDILWKPQVDLFASRTNHKLSSYFAWRADPGAIGIDAFCHQWNFSFMYAFPPFSVITRYNTKNRGGQGQCAHDNTRLAYTALVPKNAAASGQGTSATAEQQNSGDIASRGLSAPSMEEIKTDGLPFVRRVLQEEGISVKTQDIILQAWRNGTKKQYQCYIRKWVAFASFRSINPLYPTLVNILDYLTQFKGLRYSAINTARSALSSFISLSSNVSLGEEPVIKKFMKGIYNLKPTLPRYQVTWDVNKVLNYLANMPQVEKLSLKLLSHKLVMLVALITGQRCQSLHLLDLKDLHVHAQGVNFTVSSLLKQSKPGKHAPVISLRKYEQNKKLCVMEVFREYLSRTKEIRSSHKVFVSFVKPSGPVTKDTISRWIKTVMKNSGIDVT